MAENAYFLDGNITKADDNATKKRIMQQDGYLDGVGSELAVIQHTPPDMIVIAGTGEMWIQGVRFVNTAAKDVAIDAADAINPRIDRIVVRLTWASNTLEIVCLKGTAAASPSAPTLTQTAAVWENSLAQVYIPAGVTEIYTLVGTNGSYITSERLTQYCGVAGCRMGKQHNNADGTWDFGSQRGTNLTDPVDLQDASTKNYVLATLVCTEITGTSQAAAVNTRYLANNGSLVTITLPTTASVGDFVAIIGGGAGKWKLAQNADQLVCFQTATTSTGTGGYLLANHRYDAVVVRCIVANTTWVVESCVGILDVV